MFTYAELYDVFTEVQQGIPSVVYMSPESALSDRWMDWMRQHRKQFCLLAFDEGHCIVDWLDLFTLSLKHIHKNIQTTKTFLQIYLLIILYIYIYI
jgi:superfamily II DNA helicase RecQ